MKTEKYNVTGMTCAACQANVTRCVSKLEGVEEVNVSLLANQMTVSYDESKVGEEDIIQAVEKIGYGASSLEQQPAAAQSKGGFRSEWQARQDQAMNSQKQMKRRLISSIVLLVPLMYIAMGGMMGLPVPWFFVGMENSLVIRPGPAAPDHTGSVYQPALFTRRALRRCGTGRPTWIPWWPLALGRRWCTGCSPCSGMAYGFGHGDMELVHEYAHASVL